MNFIISQNMKNKLTSHNHHFGFSKKFYKLCINLYIQNPVASTEVLKIQKTPDYPTSTRPSTLEKFTLSHNQVHFVIVQKY